MMCTLEEPSKTKSFGHFTNHAYNLKKYYFCEIFLLGCLDS